ncbi:MAG: hypothetical protein IPO43_02030 [Rhodoferax sp.]|nr:hypothetical protein [Rhodoferax sp.]
MKHSSTFRGAALAFGLLALAFDGSAATLGRMQGAALIGRPLDLSVQVQLADDESSASPCLQAEVFHADNRQDPSRIRVTLEPGAQPQSGVVRIVSLVPVDEPLVTVYLRAGCSQKSSRRYVLLADVVSEVGALPLVVTANRAASAPTPLRAVIPKAGVNAGSAAAQSGPAAGKPSTNPKLVEGATPTAVVDRVRPSKLAKVPRDDTRARAVKERIAKAVGKSRLKLDMLDLTQERDPVLKASSELLSAPTDSDQRRSEAAALWRALNASPEDILRDGARVQAMDADITALKTITTRNQLGLQELGVRLRHAESERYANWLVYLLGALLLLSVLALAWLWRRRGPAGRQDWWRGSELSSELPSRLPEVVDTARSTVVSQRASLAPALTQVDIDLGAAAPVTTPDGPATVRATKQASKVTAVVASGLVQPAKGHASARLPLSTGGHLRDVDSQELVDVRHQAEFFMSLGQHEQAIEILEHRLEESGESSPWVFLDLLGIFHALGRTTEFEMVRGDFNRLFSGCMPTFARFSEDGQTLDGYAEVVRRIAALWPSARVLEFIEDCIFRNPGDESGPSFDMAAYGELLMLHGVAKRIVRVSVEGVESKSAALMRSPFKSSTFPMPVAQSRRGLANQPTDKGDDDAMMHFNLPDPR